LFHHDFIGVGIAVGEAFGGIVVVGLVEQPQAINSLPVVRAENGFGWHQDLGPTKSLLTIGV